MRKIIVRKPTHIAPFNEPARALRILNKPLWQWQRDLLAPYCDEELIVDDVRSVSRDTIETIVHSDNLWFDQAFLEYFIQEARRRHKPARAAFSFKDPAYLQQGLRALSRSYVQRGDLHYLDLWYFPMGITEQAEAVVIPSDAREIGYHHIPPTSALGPAEQHSQLVWWLPERAVCAIDSWVHLFFANIVFGIFSQANRFEMRASDPSFRFSASLRALLERKPLLSSSTYVRTGKNCSIDPTAILEGPLFIGDNVTIGPGCVVTQCIIGDNVTLTHSNHFHMCVMSDNCFFPWGASAYFTAFMENSICGQNTTIEMSVLGRNSFVGSGTVLTNFNLLPVPLKTVINDQAIELDMPVLGACIGHNTRLGSGLIVYPARMIESDVVLVASPTRRVIAKNISYEESDHHAIYISTDLHPRRYPREDQQT